MPYIASILITALAALGAVFVPQENVQEPNVGLRVLTAPQGGTGIGTVVAGDVGKYLRILDDDPFTYELATVTAGGGGSGGGPFSTSTNNLLVYNNVGDQLLFTDDNRTASSTNGVLEIERDNSTTTIDFILTTINQTPKAGLQFYEGGSISSSWLYDGSSTGDNNTIGFYDATYVPKFLINRGGGFLATASSTINANATTTGMHGVGSLFINSERFTDLTGSGLTISSNALTLNMANANTWTALQTFANASSTLFSTTYASSTQWYGGGLVSDCDTAATSKLLWDATTGQFSCGTDQNTGGGGGSGSVSTSTNEVANQVAVFTSNSATPALIGGDTDFTFSGNLLTITAASSTRLSCFGNCAFGSTATSSFASTGALTLATPLLVGSGGTGASTLTGLLQGNGTSAFTAVTDSSTVGQILRVTGASTYGWGALNLDDTDAFTGTLPVANTQLVAGRSVTLSTDTVDADVELYTGVKSIVISASGFVTATTTAAQVEWPLAATITRVSCSTDAGTATIQFDERAEATPNTAGTDVMTSTLACDTNTESTTSFANASIASRVPVNLDIDSVASSPRRVRIHIEYTVDD